MSIQVITKKIQPVSSFDFFLRQNKWQIYSLQDCLK